MFVLHAIANWLYFFFGVSGVGSHYGFWSGSGSDIGEYTIAVGIFLTLAHTIRSKNCEVHGCWRLGPHITAANHHVCRKHHPDDAPTAQEVISAHEANSGGDPSASGADSGWPDSPVAG